MHPIQKIRKLYTPIQPTIRATTHGVTYTEYVPDPVIQSYIYCYWELKTTTPLDKPFTYRVVTDGCIDVFFELNNSSENFVMGFCKK